MAAIILSDGIFIDAFRNHSPTVSANNSINNESPIWMDKLTENIRFTLPICSLPSSKLKKRWKPLAIDVFRKESIETKPATTLYIPKSPIPKAFNTIREVYNVTNIINNILKYKNKVFLAIRLLLIEDINKHPETWVHTYHLFILR